MATEDKFVTVQDSSPWQVAMVRAAIIAVLTGVVAGIGAYQLLPEPVAASLVGISTAASALLVRMGEGGYDVGRATRGAAAETARFDK